MPRIAILGGGIAGLAAVYELEQHRRAGKQLDWHLFEASDRFGGTIRTTRFQTSDGEYILEDGPDGWVTEKPWGRQLAEELGLGPDILPCNEADKRTYICLGDGLVPLPGRMRLMVPEDVATLDTSPLFTEEARQGYRNELIRSAELKAAIPPSDESVASFVRRHFGHEVLTKVAAPLLSGVFGGDVERLSVRAVMPQFVAMEREHGSLIAALQAKARQRSLQAAQCTFTSLRRGMGALIDALVAQLPGDRLHLSHTTTHVRSSGSNRWNVHFTDSQSSARSMSYVPFDQILMAVPLDGARALLSEIEEQAAGLLPADSSSAVLVTMCWPAETAHSMTIPRGFGVLVTPRLQIAPSLLAVTFATQKYPGRAPDGARILRAFFGGAGADTLATHRDTAVAELAFDELRSILGPIPSPDLALTTVRRWPRSLPQYEIGHLDRMRQLNEVLAGHPGLHLLGNSYYGVGVPDVIRDARTTARTLAEGLN